MKYPIAMIAFVMALAACGGGDAALSGDPEADETTATTAPASATSATSATVTTAEESEGTDEDTASAAAAEVSGIGEGTATIEGETYLFGDTGFPALRCEPDTFGIFFVVLNQVDETGAEVPGGGIQLTLLLEGTDPAVVGEDNSAQLSVGEQVWIADPEDITERGLEPGTSQIDSYTIDGSTVSGTATFYEEESYFVTTGGSDEPVKVSPGTFEVTCAED